MPQPSTPAEPVVQPQPPEEVTNFVPEEALGDAEAVEAAAIGGGFTPRGDPKKAGRDPALDDPNAQNAEPAPVPDTDPPPEPEPGAEETPAESPSEEKTTPEETPAPAAAADAPPVDHETAWGKLLAKHGGDANAAGKAHEALLVQLSSQGTELNELRKSAPIVGADGQPIDFNVLAKTNPALAVKRMQEVADSNTAMTADDVAEFTLDPGGFVDRKVDERIDARMTQRAAQTSYEEKVSTHYGKSWDGFAATRASVKAARAEGRLGEAEANQLIAMGLAARNGQLKVTPASEPKQIIEPSAGASRPPSAGGGGKKPAEPSETETIEAESVVAFDPSAPPII